MSKSNKHSLAKKTERLGALVVSIHDVSPLTQAEVEVMLTDLQKAGVTQCSLLVIPNHHDCGMISEHHHFIRWLQHQITKGHEVVLHGLNHLRPAAQREDWWTYWITRCYTMGEGEFYDLSYEAAFEKLKIGREQLRNAGLESEDQMGFIAPAWLLSSEAERAVKDQRFFYTTRLSGVISFKNENTQDHTPAQSMVYSVRSAPRRLVSYLWNELLFKSAKKWPLLRIGLHPPDWKYRGIRSHALSSIRRALMSRTSMTYREWVLESNDPN